MVGQIIDVGTGEFLRRKCEAYFTTHMKNYTERFKEEVMACALVQAFQHGPVQEGIARWLKQQTKYIIDVSNFNTRGYRKRTPPLWRRMLWSFIDSILFAHGRLKTKRLNKWLALHPLTVLRKQD